MMSEHDYPPNEGQEADEAAPEALSKDDIAESEAEPDEAGQAIINELQDRMLRLAAELENTRRRAEREKADAAKYAISSFARDLISVADNFERALQSAPSADDPALDEAQSALLTGVRMTEKELLRTLERHGVRKVDPTGERFDPNIHQAVAQAPAPGVPAGHVAQTAQTGFVLGDRVIRAAMVIVSTGEPEGGPGGKVDTRA